MQANWTPLFIAFVRSSSFAIKESHNKLQGASFILLFAATDFALGMALGFVYAGPEDAGEMPARYTGILGLAGAVIRMWKNRALQTQKAGK
jgi:hypothetical protein